MKNLAEKNMMEAVLAKLANCEDARLKEISASLIRHVHEFVREIEPSMEEWFAGIRFLTETGRICDDKRQEYVLLSDILGVSMLVDAIANRKPPSATESSVLGPFYQAGAPARETGTDLAAADVDGDHVHVHGKVRGLDGKPIQGATLDVWQTAPNGLYHMQDQGQDEFHLCGKFQAGADGGYAFDTLCPVSYSIPTDGPVGKYLRAMGRHPFRPAHIHFIVSAPGHKAVVTQIFTDGDEYLESDAVFGVKNSLIARFERKGSGRFEVEYDFVLEKN